LRIQTIFCDVVNVFLLGQVFSFRAALVVCTLADKLFGPIEIYL